MKSDLKNVIFPSEIMKKSSFNQHFPMLSRERSVYFPISREGKQHQSAACPSHLSKEIRHLPGLFLGACHTWATPDGTGLSGGAQT